MPNIDGDKIFNWTIIIIIFVVLSGLLSPFLAWIAGKGVVAAEEAAAKAEEDQ